MSGATYGALRLFLFSRLDQQLAQIADVDHADFYFSPQFAYRGTTPTVPTHVWVTAFDKAGNVVEPNKALAEPMTLDNATRLRLLNVGNKRPVSITTADHRRLRVQTVEAGAILSDSGVAQATVVVGLPTADVSNTLHRLLWLELIIAMAATLFALAATHFGVRAGLRRLRDVTRTARGITSQLSSDSAALSNRVQTYPGDADTEVGQLAGSINKLLEAVEVQFARRLDSEDRMRQFLLDASHELRTPLTSIRGFAELARMKRAYEDGFGTAETIAANENLHRIESEATRMSRLVDDILLLARGADRRPDSVQPVAVEELLADVVSSARAAFPARSITLQCGEGLLLVGDRDRLFRALGNVVTNAAVHTNPAGRIDVSAALDGSEILIQVRDEGPGLPAVDVKHIFDRFWRADKARSRVRGGSGLGMAIVAATVDQHGGTVTFDSSETDGSVVAIRAPAAHYRQSPVTPAKSQDDRGAAE